MIYGDPWDRDTVVSKGSPFEDRVDILAFCSFEYLNCFDWARHQGLCRRLHRTVGLVWSWFRNQPFLWLGAPGNSRCGVCGWLTRREVLFDVDRCYECANFGVCEACAYRVPSLGLRCLECSPILEFMSAPQIALWQFVGCLVLKYDRFLCFGNFDFGGIGWSFAGFRVHAATARRARRAWKMLVERQLAL